MCGRYYIDEENIEEIRQIIQEIDGQLQMERQGDVHPSQRAVVLLSGRAGLRLGEMQWGFLGYDQKRLLINARSETALERRTFRESVLHRRCIIPAGHFYEWDREKNKVSFRYPGRHTLYMAGFYRQLQGEERFVILTTEANASVERVHHRMPLLLEREELEPWIFQEECIERLLHKKQPPLESFQEYEQQTLPFL